MVIQFDLLNFMIILLCLAGVLVGVALILSLLQLRKILGSLRILVDGERETIKQSLERLPTILGDIEHIGDNLMVTTDDLRNTFPGIIQEVGHVASIAKSGLTIATDAVEKMSPEITQTLSSYKNDRTGYFHLFEELMQLIYRSLSSAKS